MVHRPRSTIAGHSAASGNASSRRWRRLDLYPQSFLSTVPTSRRTDRLRAQKGAWAQAIGTSRDGRTSKIHCLADDRGRPVAFALTPGNIADITMAIPLLEAVAPPKRLLADKAYDADRLPIWLKRTRIRAVLPSTAARNIPYPLDREAYRRRNLVERMICRLKNGRRIATRYSPRAQNYLSGLALVDVVSQWN